MPYIPQQPPACANPGRTACGAQQTKTPPADDWLGLLFSLGSFERSGQGSGRRRPRLQPSPAAVSGAVEADFDTGRRRDQHHLGYTGGRTANPSYEEVSRGGTGHAEQWRSLRPGQGSYEKLLDVFLAQHRSFGERIGSSATTATNTRQRDLLSWRRATRAGGGLEGGGCETLQAADSDRNRGGRPVL